MSEPTTEAGRALLEAYNGGSTFPIRDDILAIEAEARAQGALHAHLVNEGDIEEARAAVLRELREEVEVMGDVVMGGSLPEGVPGPYRTIPGTVSRAVVLAAIDRRLAE